MRRRLARPFGQTVPPARMLSLLMGLALLALLYQRVKEPQFWRWMTNEGHAENSVELGDATPTRNRTPAKAASVDSARVAENAAESKLQEMLVPGPNESDPEELAKLRTHFKVVQDRQPLQPHEMPAYWQLMRWSLSRPFAELEQLARRDVPYSHLWEEPDLYRGQPLRLKLHVRRVLSYAPPENPLGLEKVYEAWGWTDDSRSFPFVVVFPEKPASVPVGTDVDADVLFVGYFVKWMSYRAFDAKKNSPLLVGRLKSSVRLRGGEARQGWESAFLTLAGGVLLLSLLGWLALNGLRRPRTIAAATTAVPDQLPENWLPGSLAGASTDKLNVGHQPTLPTLPADRLTAPPASDSTDAG